MGGVFFCVGGVHQEEIVTAYRLQLPWQPDIVTACTAEHLSAPTTVAAQGKSLISIPALHNASEAALMDDERTVERGEEGGGGGEGRGGGGEGRGGRERGGEGRGGEGREGEERGGGGEGRGGRGGEGRGGEREGEGREGEGRDGWSCWLPHGLYTVCVPDPPF